MNQQFPDWELIIVEDGCADEITPRVLSAFEDIDKRIKVIHQPNQNRAIARNTGMKSATGEWICWLDSDDEYSTNYLRQLDKAIEEFPEYDIFNFSSMYHWPDYSSSVKPTFKPAIEGKGHEWFRSGNIVCGTFVFKRSLWLSNYKYRIPNEVNPFEFAAKSKIPQRLDPKEDKFKWDNTESPEGVFQDGIYRQGLSLGNPWGDDYCQFYYLTRDNQSKPLDAALYIVYPRSNEDDYKYFGELFDTDIEVTDAKD